MARIGLIEAPLKRWMTIEEHKLVKRLRELLRDDGHGHHHAKYADRLADFDINIIPNKPNEAPITAAISFKTGVITIGEGLINNPNTYYQLPTVIRHEMAHNLMMHEIRLLNLIGAEAWEIWGQSPSLHDVLNWIEDYEISNKKYNDYDKDIMRALIINGKAIPCLVTEDNRDDWKTLSVEEMFEKMSAELELMHERLQQQASIDLDDAHAQVLLSTMVGYKNIDTDSIIHGPLEAFINSGCKLKKSSEGFIEVADTYKQIAVDIFNSFSKAMPKPDDLEKLLLDIANTSPIQAYKLVNPKTGELITTLKPPEAKAFAIEVLKKYRSEYSEWYRKVMTLLIRNNYSADKIKKIYKAIKA